MTLADSLLESLSGWRIPAEAEGTHTHTHTAGDWTTALSADRADSVGCLVNEMTVARSSIDGPAIAVRPWANGVARRVSGLMEPLKVIEVDDERNEAILRSQSPTKKGDLAHFYEVHLAGTGVATLKRFKADTFAGSRREQVSFPLTHEVIAKVAGDLAEV